AAKDPAVPTAIRVGELRQSARDRFDDERRVGELGGSALEGKLAEALDRCQIHLGEEADGISRRELVIGDRTERREELVPRLDLRDRPALPSANVHCVRLRDSAGVWRDRAAEERAAGRERET